MGLMMELAKATARELSGKVKIDESREWSWAPGMILFPETRCPFCKQVLRSKAIWKVDEKGKKLLGQGVPVQGEALVMEDPFHPHASPGDGHICMGSGSGQATETTQALFYAYNPKSLLNGQAKLSIWLKSKYWDHDCPEVAVCVRCQYETPKSAHSYKDKTYCSECATYYIPQEIAKEKRKEEARARKNEAARLARAAKKAAAQAPPVVTNVEVEGRAMRVTTFLVNEEEPSAAVEEAEEEIEVEEDDDKVQCSICGEMTDPDEMSSCCTTECYECHSRH